MRFYFYQLIVTVELNIRAVLKNAWLFAILGLGRNIIATAAIIISVGVIMFVHPLIEFVAVPFIGFSFCGFIAVYTTYPIIEKYLIKPVRDAEKEKSDEEIEKALGQGRRAAARRMAPGGAGAHNHDDNTPIHK